MKKFGLFLCTVYLCAGLDFKERANTYDDYVTIFEAFDKNSKLLKSYEKLVNIHGEKKEKFKKEVENDKDGCACAALKANLTPFKDYNSGQVLYLWEEKRLIIKRECWGSGDFYFELEEFKDGVKITKKFTRKAL